MILINCRPCIAQPLLRHERTPHTLGSTCVHVFSLEAFPIRPCHTAAILSRETKRALLYHAKPRPHGFHCEAWRGKIKLFLVSRDNMAAVWQGRIAARCCEVHYCNLNIFTGISSAGNCAKLHLKAGWDENEKMRLPFGQAVTWGY